MRHLLSPTRLWHRLRTTDWERSYAQSGEDMIAGFLFRAILGIPRPTYLDIGAHHPTHLSNTYHLYRTGCRGVCVEPDPVLAAGIARARPRDVVLDVGVGVDGRDAADLHVFDDRGFNTFSAEVSGQMVGRDGQRVREVIRVKLVPVNDILARHFDPWPNFVSIDTEGLDLEILRAIDFRRFRPEVFCVETLTSTTWLKIPEVGQFMASVGYEVYADTNLNTLFVESDTFKRRRKALGR